MSLTVSSFPKNYKKPPTLFFKKSNFQHMPLITSSVVKPMPALRTGVFYQTHYAFDHHFTFLVTSGLFLGGSGGVTDPPPDSGGSN